VDRRRGESRADPLATITEPVSRQGYRQLRQFAARWPTAVWAIEGTSELGAPLASRLSGDGIGAVDVPAKLAARVPMLSTGHGRKNDDADAVSVGIAALTAPGLRRSAVDETIVSLRALVEHRDDIVRTRTQTINRLHVLLTQLLPGGAPRQLSGDTAAAPLRTLRPHASGARTLRRLAADLIARSVTWTGASPPAATTSQRRSPKPVARSPSCAGTALYWQARSSPGEGDISRFRSTRGVPRV
jgi:transposase